MKHLRSTCALLALSLAAIGCASEAPPTIDETRGPLRVSGYATETGGAVVDITQLDGAPVATVSCDATLRQLTLTSPLDPAQAGVYDLPAEVIGCDLTYTAEFAVVSGRGLMNALNEQAAVGSDQVAFDAAGCDGIGGDSICCARHDACYAANDCSAWSWLTTGLVWSFTACGRCNNAAVYCLIGEALQ
ncbi:MAG: hypothetical protein IPL61_37925 [Myxococcales bacterium]|nr:hypothetical protein [Myxococcales bacterium]